MILNICKTLIKRVSNGSFLFYVYNHRGNLKNWFSITKFTELGWNDWVFKRTEEHRRCSGSEIVKSWSREDVKLKSFTLWLEIWTIRFLNAKIFLSSLCFKEAKLAKFIRFEALWELLFKQAYFLSQSSRRAGEMIAFLRALRNIGTQSLESLRSNVCFLVKI